VTLFLFGGVTEIGQEAKTPGDELRITIVGPITSLLLGAGLLAGASAAGDTDDLWPGAIAYLGVINLTLGVFNLLPGFPLDGGRVLRSIVWASSGDRPRATRVATSAGDALGWLLVALGVLALLAGSLAGFWTIGIGMFLSMSARAAGFHARLAASLEGRVASDLMSPEPICVDADQTVADAVRTTLLHDDHRLYPVVGDGATVGLLRLEDVRAMSSADRPTTPVSSMMVPLDTATVVEPSTPGTDVLDRLGTGGSTTRLVVVRDDQVIGVIAPEDLERWLRRTEELGLDR
jgi:CBS domain-containing protein